jgi:hypothetical protein
MITTQFVPEYFHSTVRFIYTNTQIEHNKTTIKLEAMRVKSEWVSEWVTTDSTPNDDDDDDDDDINKKQFCLQSN